MKRSRMYSLICFFVLTFVFVMGNDKLSYAKELSEHSLNLVKNGDFNLKEDSQNKWTGKSATNWNTPWIPKSVKDKYHITVTDDGVLRMDSDAEMRAVVGQDITVESNQKYIFSARIKTEALKSNIGARVRILSYDSNNKQKSNLWYSKNLVGDNDWTTITGEFVSGEDIVKIRLELFYETGTGTAYFDDVSLLKSENTTSIENEGIKEIEFDNSVTLNINKQWLLPGNYQYEVKDNSIASVEDGFIVPKKIGTTELMVSAPGKKDKVVSLVVEESNNIFDSLLQKWDTMISGNRYFDSQSNYMNKIFESNEKDVESYLAKLQNNDKKIWDDLADYTKSANLTKTYRRLEQIAKSVTNPKSKYYNDKEVINIVKRSMKLMEDNYYNENTESKGNWWDYEIGVPRAINNILTIMNHYFSKEEIVKLLLPISKMVPDPSKIMVSQNRGKKAVGGNLSDLGKVKVIEGILLEDNEKLEVAINTVSNVLELVSEGEGFHYDGSYVDHTNIAYTGAYGNVLIDGFSQLLPVIQASPYKIEQNKLKILYNWIYEGFLPLIYRGELMDMTRGRSLSRKIQNDHYAAVEVLRGIMRIAEASEQSEKNKLQGIVKDIVKSDNYYDTFLSLKSFYDVYLFETLLSNNMVGEIERNTYLKLYNDMNKVAYYNKERGFAFGISMHSDKIQNYEFMNKENAKGWYTSDGVSYLYNDDLSHFSDDYWATVDPYKLPGITENNKAREKGLGMTTMKNSFVGSTSLNQKFGTVAMDFSNLDNTMSAKKAWFILGDRVVFLGSGVKDASGTNGYTVIENRKIKRSSRNRSMDKEDYKVIVDGKEKTVDSTEIEIQANNIFLKSSNKEMNIGYKFLKTTSLNVKKETRSGTWKDINESQSNESVENTFLTIVQPHDMVRNSYAYVLYPNRNDKEFESEVNKEDITVIENSENNQVVYDKSNNIYGVVKYDDSELKLEDNLVLKEKGIYTIQKELNKIKVAFLDPTNSNAHLNELKVNPYVLKQVIEPSAEDRVRYLIYESKVERNENKDLKNDDKMYIGKDHKLETNSKESTKKDTQIEEHNAIISQESKKIENDRENQLKKNNELEEQTTSSENGVEMVNTLSERDVNKNLPNTGTRKIESAVILPFIFVIITIFYQKNVYKTKDVM